MANHKAAIHALKSKLGMSDDDYRALLLTLTGVSSSKDMTDKQQRQVRDRLQSLGERMGVVQATTKRRPLTHDQFALVKKETRPKERKVWALWNQLNRDGKIGNPSAAALNAWVLRQVDVSALRFATDPQLDTLIEALKAWQERN
ncbi:MAG: regulatory protein GemA [Comamonas sp.]